MIRFERINPDWLGRNHSHSRFSLDRWGIRGAGLGSATIAVMAGAFAEVPHGEVPDASSTTRIVQEVGGSFGAAVLATILAQQLALHPERAVAYDAAFWWAIGFAAIALVPELFLAGRPRTPAAVEVGEGSH
jgi:hypothetical protein